MPLLSLRVSFHDSRWAWYLKPGDEIDVFVGAELVTTLGADLLRQMVGHYLSHAHLTATVLQGHRAIRPGLPTAAPRKPPQPLGVPAQAVQDARRAKRHRRKHV